MPRRTRLTPYLIEDIVRRVKAGTYAYIAAEAAGVPRSTFYAWMQKGGQQGARGVYRDFYDSILRASAAARSHAEIRTFRDRPYDWLRTGPGREGWSERAEVKISGRVEHDHQGEIEHKRELRAISRRVFADTLLAAEEMGYLRLTDLGRQTLLPPPEEGEVIDTEIIGEGDDGEVIDVESTPPEDGNHKPGESGP